MGFLRTIRRLDRGFAWSFLGFLLATIFGGLAIYTEFFKRDLPLVEIQLLSNTPVLDVRENLPELEVLYQRQDISKTDQALSVLLLRIINRGSANLLSSDYDAKAPLRLTVRSATLIRAELASASNEYLTEVAGVRMLDSSSVTFHPVILEPGESYLVKLLVLHATRVRPSVTAKGKIAGMQRIPLVVPVPEAERDSFWRRTLSGGIWVQIVRMVAYAFAALASILLVVVPAVLLASAVTTQKRRKVVERFRALRKVSPDTSSEFIFKLYVESGLPSVTRLKSLLTDPDKLPERVKQHLWEERHPTIDRAELEWHGPNVIVESERPGTYLFYPGLHDIGRMIGSGVIKEVDGRWIADSVALKLISSFVEYVELVGAP